MARLLIEAEYCGITISLFGARPILPPHSAAAMQAIARWTLPKVGVSDPLSWSDRIKKITVLSAGEIASEVSGETYADPVLFESMSYDVYLDSKGCSDVSIRAGSAGLLQHIRDFGSLSHYRMEVADDVGLVAIELTSGDHTLARLELEVFPRKIDYRADYGEMLAEISAVAPALVFDAAGSAAVPAALTTTNRQTSAEWYEILRAISSEFVKLIDLIARDPQRRLDLATTRVPIERARRITKKDFEAELKRPGALMNAPSHLAIPFVPRRVAERSVVPDFDAEGNRFLRWLLRQVLSRLGRLELELRAPARGPWNTLSRISLRDRWLGEIHWLRPQIQSRLSYDWLACCAEPRNLTPSASLQAHPLYGRAFELGRCLLRGLRADETNFTEIGSRSISQLYEYWCFFAIINLLRRDAQLVQCNAILLDFQGSRLSLRRGRETAVTFRHRKTGRQFQIYYNRQYETPTVSQRPDATLHIESSKGIHVFDAKYRLQFDEEYIRTYGAIGPKVEDISTMHRYRDAIVVGNSGAYLRMVTSACVLFPWNDASSFRGHVFAKSLDSVGIGGLPFLPGCTELVADRLARIIQDAVGV